ncbi:MAG: hypothetical protein IRZ10_10060 [Thermoflavifilum sp.]|nr:hypothetical protein [Thermoflavifilum sp.]MCL6514752.1 hypothetical protein [Alicyclobacillus sp.]
MRVYGLVGPSGSGKSHHAPEIAQRLHVRAILDDGVLIKDGRLVAGHSAKFERNPITAIRRALLTDPVHAAEIRRALRGETGVLVLGTSRRMVEMVTRQLQLPAPQVWLDIASFVPEEQRRLAQSLRRYGMHAVPAVPSPGRGSRLERWLHRLRYTLPGHAFLAPNLPQLTIVRAAFADGAIHVHPRAVEDTIRIFTARAGYPLQATHIRVRTDAMPVVQMEVRAQAVPDLRQQVERYLHEVQTVLRQALALPAVAVEVRVTKLIIHP